MKPMKTLTTAALVVVALALQACASLNPVSRAETLSQKAYATYGVFVVYEEQAAVIVQDANVSASVKKALGSADALAKPVADKLIESVLALDGVRADLAAGQSTEEKLLIATANLQKWYDEVVPLVRDLAAQVQGARR